MTPEDLIKFARDLEELKQLMMPPVIKVKRLDDRAKVPTKTHQDDAGFDVYPAAKYHGVVIPPKGNILLGTNIAVEIPKGYCIQVNPRSGKAFKNGLVLGARIIDSPYRGELKLNIMNRSNDAYEISRHDPIAQLLVLKVAAEIVEVSELSDTSRGDGRFGSTNDSLKKHSIKQESQS